MPTCKNCIFCFAINKDIFCSISGSKITDELDAEICRYYLDDFNIEAKYYPILLAKLIDSVSHVVYRMNQEMYQNE